MNRIIEFNSLKICFGKYSSCKSHKFLCVKEGNICFLDLNETGKTMTINIFTTRESMELGN